MSPNPLMVGINHSEQPGRVARDPQTVNLLTTAVSIAALMLVQGCARSISADEALTFFNRFASLEAAYDASRIQLYSDNAIIILSRRTPSGTSESFTVAGAEWKSTLAESLEYEKSTGDFSSYSFASVEINEDTARISATRYSNSRCYRDDLFYLVIQRKQDGDLEIIEMRADTQAESECR